MKAKMEEMKNNLKKQLSIKKGKGNGLTADLLINTMEYLMGL